MFSKHDLHEAMKLTLGEWPMQAITPRQMRVGLARANYYSTLLRNISIMTEREGWTGEDKYTAMTFYLQLRLEVLEDQNYRHAMLEPMPSFIVSKESVDADLFKR